MWDLSSPTRARTCLPCIGRRILNHWTTREVPVQYLYFKPRMSGSKHKTSGDVAGTAKKNQAITMETKVKIIERVERGEKMVVVVVLVT